MDTPPPTTGQLALICVLGIVLFAMVLVFLDRMFERQHQLDLERVKAGQRLPAWP